MDTFNNPYTNNSFTSKQNNNQPVKRFSPITKRRKINLKKLVTILVVFLLVIFGASKIVSKIRNPQAKNQTETNRPSQKITLNKNFEFIALDSSKDEEEKIEMTLTTAEITNEVLVQDKTFRSKDDKAFLIVNLELKNDNERQLNIFPGDLVRLMVGSEDKKFAPDLHNNVVLIRPISTKIDRLGFVIQTGTKDLKLLVGAVDAKKETVPLNFGP
jgi:hypothetical protein